MPLYCYKCNACGFCFESWHSMSFDSQTCTRCRSESVFRIPSMQESITAPLTAHRPGHIVGEYIEDAKKEIKQEKKDLKSREL